MSEALGAYLKTLRTGQGLKVADVVRELSRRLGQEVDPSRLWRAESGKAWPDGDFLTALADIIHARLPDLAWIQQHPDADEAEGAKRARLVLAPEERALIRALADDDQHAVLTRVAELTDDPALAARIRGYLDGLKRE